MYNLISNSIHYLLHPFSSAKPTESETLKSPSPVLSEQNISDETNKNIITIAIRAIKEHDLNRLNELLDEGLNPNSRDDRGFSLIHIAVLKTSNETEKTQLNLIKSLLNHGANVNAYYIQDSFGPLTTAVRRKLPDVVDLLLKNGADTSLRIKKYNKTALDYAMEFKDERGLKVVECFKNYMPLR